MHAVRRFRLGWLFRAHFRNADGEPSLYPLAIHPNDEPANRLTVPVLPLDLEPEVAARNHPLLLLLRLGLRPHTNSCERRQPNHDQNGT
jgi:hypothetical protein